jgi:glycosyltransferase involved in cell wall biosynthesis
MRLLFGLHTYPPEGKGGTEIHAHALAKAFSKTCPVRVVAREGDPSKPDFAVTREVFEGVEITRINHLWRDVDSFEGIYKNRRVHELFEAELVDFKPDLVHLHHLTGLSTTIVETIKRGGLPLVLTLHDFWTVCPRGQRMTKELDLCESVDRNVCFHCLSGIWPQFFRDFDAQRIELDSRGKLAPKDLAEFDRHMAYVLGLADVLVAPSEFHRERMLDFPLPADRLVAVPHGLDHAPFRGVVRPLRPVKKIGYLGSVIPVKGVHVLVEAFNRLKRADLELHVYGESFAFHDDRSYFERLKARAVGRPNVHFHGAYRQVDLPRILANLDVLVVPSLWWESYCLTIREGLLAGVPVVASDLGAMREALDGERNGLLFRAGDSQDLADRLRSVVEDDALRERLSNRREAVKTIDRNAEELLAVYERARRESAERAGSLVVAPPSFPKPPEAVRLHVASVRSSDGLVVETQTPSDDGRSALVKVRLKDGAEAVLRVDVGAAKIAETPPPPLVDRRAEMHAAEAAAREKAAAEARERVARERRDAAADRDRSSASPRRDVAREPRSAAAAGDGSRGGDAPASPRAPRPTPAPEPPRPPTPSGATDRLPARPSEIPEDLFDGSGRARRDGADSDDSERSESRGVRRKERRGRRTRRTRR